jgi:hypothetical protein
VNGQPLVVTDNIVVCASEVSYEDALAFALDGEVVLRNIVTLLGRAPAGKVHVMIDSSVEIPHAIYSLGRVMIPCNRLDGFRRIENPSMRQKRGPAFAHELVHLVARTPDENLKYLEEGLAVYAQEFCGSPWDIAYPNYGADLHVCAARLLRLQTLTVPIDSSERFKKGTDKRWLRRAAYLQEGSFARYLVENHGIKALLRVLDGEPYSSVYGTRLVEMERKWRDHLDSVADVYSGKRAHSNAAASAQGPVPAAS